MTEAEKQAIRERCEEMRDCIPWDVDNRTWAYIKIQRLLNALDERDREVERLRKYACERCGGTGYIDHGNGPLGGYEPCGCRPDVFDALEENQRLRSALEKLSKPDSENWTEIREWVNQQQGDDVILSLDWYNFIARQALAGEDK